MSDNQETHCKGLGSHTCPESHTTLRLYKSKEELRRGLRHRNRLRMLSSFLATLAVMHAGGALHAARHVDGKIVEAFVLLFGGLLFLVYEFYAIWHNYNVAYYDFQVDTADEESGFKDCPCCKDKTPEEWAWARVASAHEEQLRRVYNSPSDRSLN
jgi:hypothetical protein